MNEGRNLVTEALEDAKSLREAATEAAKKQLIEQMTPAIKKMVEQSMRSAMSIKNEDTDRIRRGVHDNWPGESHSNFEEGKEKGEKSMDDEKTKSTEELDAENPMEALMGMFPALSELDLEMDGEEQVEDVGMPAIPTLGEGEDEVPGEEPKMEAKKDDDKEKDKMDEEIEISEEQLRQVYESAMQVSQLAEVQVTKGFGEMTKSGEIDELDPGAGIADVKKGEHNWEKETPPAKQDFTVKEAIRRGLAENKALRAKLVEAVKLINTLRESLSEVNLFNAKVLHVNRILNKNGRLTKEQKMVVLESIDKARSIDEVKMVYETIESSFKATGALVESRNPRKPVANAQKARTSGTPKAEVLRESVDRSEQTNPAYSRMRQLAGLVK